MKQFLLLLLLAVIAALAIWYGLRVAEQSSPVAVTSLLPKETLFVAHVPDLNSARSQWHKTDLYRLWREPAVQDFFQKPLSKIPTQPGLSQSLEAFEQLDPKDLFVAVTAWDDNGPKAVGGFRFKGRPEDAERIIGDWHDRIQKRFPNAQPEVVEYEEHQIHSVTAMRQTFATVFDKNWIFAANNLDGLKLILDRADHRIKERETTLGSDDMFAAAFKHMPSSYAALVFGRIDRYLERMAPLLTASGVIQPGGQTPLYEQIHTFCGALAFDGGRIRDTLFVGMPRLVDAGTLTRASLPLGTKETFLYLATFLNLSKQMPWPAATQPKPGSSAILTTIVDAIASSGITLEQWNTAFGPEFGLIGNWPQDARLPSILTTLPVRDSATANEVLTKLTKSTSNLTWTDQEKDGVRYLSMQPGSQLTTLAPSLALSERMLIAGTEATAVEVAMHRSTEVRSELANSAEFRAAEHAVPAPKQAFFYIDSSLLYSRLDTTLRPVLMLGAAFMPSLGQNLDLVKWPESSVITKHLSPIVMSQNYQRDGYVTESVGPVTMYQAIVSLLGGAAAVVIYEQQTHGKGIDQWSRSPRTPLNPMSSPNPTP